MKILLQGPRLLGIESANSATICKSLLQSFKKPVKRGAVKRSREYYTLQIGTVSESGNQPGGLGRMREIDSQRAIC